MYLFSLAIVLLTVNFPLAKAETIPISPIQCHSTQNPHPLLGPRTRKTGYWRGRKVIPSSGLIVVMAGHADSQNMISAGTPGYAVGVLNAEPMNPNMQDELFWNLEIQKAVVRIGQQKGLKIISYKPPKLTIQNNDNPHTNWSQAKIRSEKGDYILEIHFDAWSPHGFGSGLIPALNRQPNLIDETLAKSFGRFPRNFRGGLGGPKRGISILEVGMLMPPLEQKLRDPSSRILTIKCISNKIVAALEKGVN